MIAVTLHAKKNLGGLYCYEVRYYLSWIWESVTRKHKS